jgi:hypothetical protein
MFVGIFSKLGLNFVRFEASRKWSSFTLLKNLVLPCMHSISHGAANSGVDASSARCNGTLSLSKSFEEPID